MASGAESSTLEPFKTRLLVYARWSLGLTILFLITYGTTNWLAAQRTTHWRLYFDWELGVPFVPWMIYVYLSFNLLAAWPLFLLDVARIQRFGRTFALATLVAAVAHLAFPADLGWSRAASVPDYPVFARFFTLDRPFNLVPSLHVGYSALTSMVIWNGSRHVWIRILVASWLGLLICSVFLVHQHHLADVVGGLVLAIISYGWFAKDLVRNEIDGIQ